MFKTEWICILTSGLTVDGREIEAETLQEVAENYDPKIYNARINIDHNPASSKLGSVLELKTEQDNDKIKLFAILKPNDYLLYFVQRDQKIHTSCEITANFIDTGKSYLTGLAVTDDPASIGTTIMHLSAERKPEIYSTNEQLPNVKPKKLTDIFKNEASLMDKAVLEAIEQLKADQQREGESLSDILDQLTKLTALKTAKNIEKVAEKAPDEIKALEEKYTGLSKSIEEIKTLLANQTDEQNRRQATGERTPDEVV